MIHPEQILDQARRGLAPPGSLVIVGKRSAIGGFFTGTSHDPDPLLVFLREGVIHYRNSQKPITFIDFASLSDVRLAARASTTSDSSFATLYIWLDLYPFNAKKSRWVPPSGFGEETLIAQRFIEYYTLHKVYYRKP